MSKLFSLPTELLRTVPRLVSGDTYIHFEHGDQKKAITAITEALKKQMGNQQRKKLMEIAEHALVWIYKYHDKETCDLRSALASRIETPAEIAAREARDAQVQTLKSGRSLQHLSDEELAPLIYRMMELMKVHEGGCGHSNHDRRSFPLPDKMPGLKRTQNLILTEWGVHLNMGAASALLHMASFFFPYEVLGTILCGKQATSFLTRYRAIAGPHATVANLLNLQSMKPTGCTPASLNEIFLLRRKAKELGPSVWPLSMVCSIHNCHYQAKSLNINTT
jgi:hypothetical protein